MQPKSALFWFLLQRYGAQSLWALGASRAASWWGRLHIYPAPYISHAIIIIQTIIFWWVSVHKYIGRRPQIIIRAWHYFLLIWRQTLTWWVYCPKHASVPSLRNTKMKTCTVSLVPLFHQKLPNRASNKLVQYAHWQWLRAADPQTRCHSLCCFAALVLTPN